jgi:hypothetical protein
LLSGCPINETKAHAATPGCMTWSAISEAEFVALTDGEKHL